MSSSNRDSASKIRELTNKTLLGRAQQRDREAKAELEKAISDLAEAKRAYKQSSDEVDQQLEELCVAFDTLVEFIVLNHGDIPEKLIEIIAARQEQRITASLPKPADPKPIEVNAGQGYARVSRSPTHVTVGGQAAGPSDKVDGSSDSIRANIHRELERLTAKGQL